VIERVCDGQIELALILRSNFRGSGIEFLTPSYYSQQLGYMNRPAGYVIPPHLHNPVTRQVAYTKEVLFIRSGKVRVDFYSEDQIYLESKVLFQGDIVLLAFGGHGFEMIEPSEIIEVKQGPYAGDADKTRFAPISSKQILFKEVK
jgi:mannose-6-phosphate isomerase-like protein (cupin superfamily)